MKFSIRYINLVMPFCKFELGVAQTQTRADTSSMGPISSCTSNMAEDILPVRTSQTSMTKFALPLLRAEKSKFNENVAMFFYTTGTSFARVQDQHLLKAFNICRPGTLFKLQHIFLIQSQTNIVCAQKLPFLPESNWQRLSWTNVLKT